MIYKGSESVIKKATIAEAFGIPISELVDQLKPFRSVASVKKLSFSKFSEMAKFILTRTSDSALKHLHFLYP